MKERKKYLLEILIGGILLVVMCCVRFSYLTTAGAGITGDRRFLEFALWKQGAELPYFSSTLHGVYTGALRLLFWFAGNKEYAVICAQAVLQILTLFVFFLALKRLAGLWASAAVCLSLMFWKQGLGLMTEAVPGNLLLLFAAVYFWILAAALVRAKRKQTVFSLIGSFVITGIFCGMVSALDSYGLVLAILTMVLICLSGKLPVGFLLGFSAGSIGLFLGKSLLFGLELTAPYQEYWNSYGYQENWNPFFRFGPSSLALDLLTVLFALGGLFWAVREMIRRKKSKNTEAESRIPEIAVADIESLPVPKQRMIPQEEEKEKTAEGTPEKKIKYIENPLPVPKRHVKKEMTYAFEPDEQHMCYDLTDLPEGADYDID